MQLVILHTYFFDGISVSSLSFVGIDFFKWHYWFGYFRLVYDDECLSFHEMQHYWDEGENY